ncbi:MAG: signal peptidase II [Lentisphaeria bacterium]|nr:signal peptidase II [Lentisphaeria bacterium]
MSETGSTRPSRSGGWWFSPWRLPLVISTLVFMVDQWTKWLVLVSLDVGEFRPVFDSFFHLVHYRNTGAAWGMFEGKTFLLGLLSVIILAGMIWKFNSLADGRRTRALGLALIMGGTLGNVYDRFFRGEVVDFLLVFFRSFRWPAFNVADSAICCGVGLYLFSSVFFNDMSEKLP